MDVCDSSTLHVAVLNSMFTQAHLLGRVSMLSTLKRLWELINAGDPVPASAAYGEGTISINNATVAVVVQYAPSIASLVVLPRSVPKGGAGLADAYSNIGSRLGFTLGNGQVVRTQKQTGCVVPCTTKEGSTPVVDAGHCGSCALVTVGSATFAAVPAHVHERDPSGANVKYEEQSYTRNYAGNALYNLAYYSNSYETPKWTYQLPWCVGNLDEQPEAEPWPWGDFVSVLMQNISSLANGDHPFKRFSAKNTTLNSANPSSVGGGTDVMPLHMCGSEV
jgi:hypothetical protein